jgi:hypothetical protein
MPSQITQPLHLSSWCSLGLNCSAEVISPKDRDSTLLGSIGFYQLIHMVIQPQRTSSGLSLQWKTYISHSPSLSQYCTPILHMYFLGSSYSIHAHHEFHLDSLDCTEVCLGSCLCCSYVTYIKNIFLLSLENFYIICFFFEISPGSNFMWLHFIFSL